MHSRFFLLCAATMLAAFGGSEAHSATASIDGTATYRERMMLPPTAVLEVTLEDVSRADAATDIIARTQVQTLTASPYSFTLTYDPARMKVGHRYTIRARILNNGTLMFQSSTGYPITGLGVVQRVHLEMRRVGNEPRSAAPASRQLRGVYEFRADAGWFVDCDTGMRLVVAQEGDNAALEAAFSKARKTWMDAPMLATVQGRVEPRTPMVGLGRPTLIVEKFVGIEPRGCPGLKSSVAGKGLSGKATQSVERRTVNPLVVGSSPTQGAT